MCNLSIIKRVGSSNRSASSARMYSVVKVPNPSNSWKSGRRRRAASRRIASRCERDANSPGASGCDAATARKKLRRAQPRFPCVQKPGEAAERFVVQPPPANRRFTDRHGKPLAHTSPVSDRGRPRTVIPLHPRKHASVADHVTRSAARDGFAAG